MRPLAALWLAPLAALPAQERATTAWVQLTAGSVVRDLVSHDVDGDGRIDLVIASEKDERHALTVHLQRSTEPRFAGKPDARVELTRDVVAFAVADVHADPGAEIVLFTATGAFAYRSRGAERSRFVKLFAAEFLWQRAAEGPLAWQLAVRDLDGDGRDDLLVPEPGGYRVALQRRTGDETEFACTRLTLRGTTKRNPFGDSERFEFRFGPPGRNARPAPILRVTEAVGAPQPRDWDGDGDLDILALHGDSVQIFLQEPAGRFAARALRTSVAVSEERRRFDVAHRVLVGDLDGDRKVDGIALAGDRDSEDLRTQVLIFRQGKGRRGAERPASDPLFGPEAVPDQLLVLAGFAIDPRLEDIDGDGRPDLVLGAIRIDLIDRLRATSTEQIDAELYVYLNRGGSFPRRPDLTHDVTLTGEVMRSGVGERIYFRFFGDVDGDGTRDLLVRDRPERLRMLRTRRTRRGVRIDGDPFWTMRLDKDARTRFLPRRGCPDLAILEKGQVVHVRFR